MSQIIIKFNLYKINSDENHFTAYEIIELAMNLTPSETELETVLRLEFDETVEYVIHGLIFQELIT